MLAAATAVAGCAGKVRELMPAPATDLPDARAMFAQVPDDHQTHPSLVEQMLDFRLKYSSEYITLEQLPSKKNAVGKTSCA